MSKLAPKEHLTAARMKLFINHVFYANIMKSQRLVLDEPGINTMAVDGKHLFVNTAWAAQYKIPEVVGVLIHEMEHIIRKHHLRRGNRDPRLFNIAGDGSINYELLKMGIQLPQPRVCLVELLGKDETTGLPWIAGKTVEAIYNKLRQMQREGGEGRDPTEGMGDEPGGVLDLPPDQDPAQAEVELNVAIHEAAMAERAKSKGDLPANIARHLAEVSKPRIVWQDWVREQVRNSRPTTQSWARPNRRLLGIAPGWNKSGLGKVLIFQDTSGSMSSGELAYSRSEVISLLSELLPEALVFLACDARVNAHEEIGPDDDIDPRWFKGGGGSDFRPAFAYASENIDDVDVAIVLSDMMIDFPVDPPPYPVIGVTTTDHVGPDWMTTIKREAHHA